MLQCLNRCIVTSPSNLPRPGHSAATTHPRPACRSLPAPHPTLHGTPQPDPEEPADYDFAWLGDFVDRLSEFDKEMNGVVIESGGGGCSGCWLVLGSWGKEKGGDRVG